MLYDMMNETSPSDRRYIVYCTAPSSLNVQPKDGLFRGQNM